MSDIEPEIRNEMRFAADAARDSGFDSVRIDPSHLIALLDQVARLDGARSELAEAKPDASIALTTATQTLCSQLDEYLATWKCGLGLSGRLSVAAKAAQEAVERSLSDVKRALAGGAQ